MDFILSLNQMIIEGNISKINRIIFLHKRAIKMNIKNFLIVILTSFSLLSCAFLCDDNEDYYDDEYYYFNSK